MPIAEIRDTVSRSPMAEEDVTYPVSVLLSLRREQTAPLLRAMRSQHVLPALSHAWGSELAYGALLHEAGTPLAVLDVPSPRWSGGLEQRVRVLSRISSVMVLVPDHTESTELLSAGAANVVPRDTPSKELGSRIAAERRWLDMRPSSLRRPATDPSEYGLLRPQQRSQQVLFDILCSASQPWCCHDLCLMLGTAEQPMSRRALQARIARLEERLMPYGISVDCTARWGRTTYMGFVEEPGNG
ncbi:hypothetical protein ACH4U3_41890 [Streptomyces griseoruber]|uniref:hypothetical protein n=1 Tax=Streptomyces griseoruber TaxID=1943 RepID=UPI0037B2F8A0